MIIIITTRHPKAPGSKSGLIMTLCGWCLTLPSCFMLGNIKQFCHPASVLVFFFCWGVFEDGDIWNGIKVDCGGQIGGIWTPSVIHKADKKEILFMDGCAWCRVVSIVSSGKAIFRFSEDIKKKKTFNEAYSSFFPYWQWPSICKHTKIIKYFWSGF